MEPQVRISESAGRWVLVVTALGSGLVLLEGTVVNVALPALGSDLDASMHGLQWTVNAFTLSLSALTLLGGGLGDRLGRRRVYLVGIAWFGAASLLCGIAPSMSWLIAARTLQGIGGALIVPGSLALIQGSFHPDDRNRAVGWWAGMSGVAGAAGPVVGGGLIDVAGWRWVFFVNVPFGVVLAMLAPRILTETRRRSGRFDVAGAVASTAGMTALVYALIRVGSDGWGDGRALAGFAAAAVLLAGFAAVERRAGEPVLPLWLLTGRDRAASYLTQFLLVAAMFGAYFFLTQYLQQVLGYGPLRAGAAFLPMVVMQFATVRAVPRVLPRLGARTLVVAGTALVAIGLLWLSGLSPEDGYASGLLGPFVLVGAGGGISIMPLNATILGSVEPEQSGAASGVAQTMLWTGGSLGSAVLVTVHGSAVPDGAVPGGAVVEGMTAAFAAGAVFAAAALLVALFVLRVRR